MVFLVSIPHLLYDTCFNPTSWERSFDMPPIANLVPAVSVMGLMGPAGLMNVQVVTSTIPTTNFHNNCPEGRFQNLEKALGFSQSGAFAQHHGPFRPIEDFEKGDSYTRLISLAEATMPAGKKRAASGENLIEMGIDALAAAESEFNGDMTAAEGEATKAWLASGGVFTNINDDPDLSLVALYVVGRDPIKAAIGKDVISPSIATQMGAQALLGGPRSLYADVMRGHNDDYIRLWGSVDEMMEGLGGKQVIEIQEFVDGIRPHEKSHELSIKDESRFREYMDDLVRNSVFNPSAEVRDAARWIIWEASQKLGAPSASIHDFYMARAEGKWDNMTVPAINIRGLTYDMARLIFRKLKEINAGAAIFEIAKSEIGYTDQRPAEYAATVLAAAIREGWEGPVFLQGDHFQVGLKDYKADPKAAVESVKGLIREAVEAGFYNIDIDTSTLVDLDREMIAEQQRDNYKVAAELTKLIREIEPEGITISVGGEIGEIGTGNSTPEELRAFMEGYMGALGPEDVGISKISIQTGTSHGGVPLPDGTVADVKIDFEVIEELGKIAREEYAIGGVVQHGASTLPDEAFHHFRERGATEVHLATGFQNVILDSGVFPAALTHRLLETIRPEVDATLAKALDAGEDVTKAQAIYKTRKKGFKPLKRAMWSLPLEARAEIMAELAVKFGMLFGELGVADTRKLVNPFVRTVEIHMPLGGTVAEAKIEEDDNPLAD